MVASLLFCDSELTSRRGRGGGAGGGGVLGIAKEGVRDLLR